MLGNYLKDVSALIAMLKVERALLPQLFAFLYSNYSCYLTYQDTLLEVHFIWNTSVWKGLKDDVFRGRLILDKFLTKHVDLFLETTGNIEVKVRRELMQGGYSTDLDTMNMFVKSSNFLIKLQRINLLASLKHKKATPGAR